MRSEITKLIEKYNREKGKKYNEEATKNDFILPLFKILGWNVEDSNDVSKEENISGKRVDYGFRIDGIPKFFLEAKGLDEDLEGSRMVKGRQVTYAEQAINYAYYKGCNWAILTNFKGIIVYDAWAKANSHSSFRFAIWVDSLLSDFESVYLLSKDAFGQGLLDKKYSTKSRKRPITEQLLLDFTNFRAILSKDVYALNKSKNLTEEELDEAIQRLFDRLIFIRNCEDRELEPYELLSALRQWKESRKGTLVSKLRALFAYYDDTYDSKIFGDGKPHLCDQIDISDNVLSRILDGLYTTEDGSIQYDFSLIDADVLGNIYEQYLGHILKKTEKRTKLTESKAKRKEEGIYYTPSYIVDYIVRNTVGELVKNKKTDVSKIKVLDPACGSGSFLIKTFDVLNEYHSKKEGYSQNKLDMSGTGTTYSTKLSILKDNIFGVDLDKQAVDIAQLNLLLKIAEKKRRLPILQQNIKNGNSLIDDPNLAGDKAFKWNEEFAEIIGNGGFDVVVGNPPYVSVKALPQNEKTFFVKSYETAKGQFDLYGLFIEKAIKLMKEEGLFGFITSNTFLSNKDFKLLRELIVNSTKIKRIIDLRETVFTQANLDVSIIILEKCSIKNERESNKMLITDNPKDFESNKSVIIPQSTFMEQENYEFRLHIDKQTGRLLEKIKNNSIPLRELVSISRGIEKGSNESIQTDSPENLFVPILVGKDIDRYSITFKNRYIKYNEDSKADFKSRDIFDTTKILVQRIRNLSLKRRIVATLDSNRFYTMNTLRILTAKSQKVSLSYIVALLNSKLINYWFLKMFNNKDIYAYQLEQIPIRITEEKISNKLIILADRMLLLHKELSASQNRTDKHNSIEEEIKKIDTEIDDLVYKIYGITEEEKKVIEESLK